MRGCAQDPERTSFLIGAVARCHLMHHLASTLCRFRRLLPEFRLFKLTLH